MLVLRRNQLETLYGPSLATRPQFLVDYPAEKHKQIGEMLKDQPTTAPEAGQVSR
jgi:hypothetical protein